MKNSFLYSDSDSIEGCTEGIIAQIQHNTIGHKPLRIVIFGSDDNNASYIKSRDIIGKIIEEHYGDESPVWSYIAQPPFEADMAAEVWWVDDEQDWDIDYKSYNERVYISMERDEVKRLLIGGLHSTPDKTIAVQAWDICNDIEEIFRREKMPLSSIVRQWNYIENITLESLENQNYQEFNDARSELYNQTEWATGYPAATGIGTIAGGLIIDIDAVTGCEVKTVNNALQVAAHSYSKSVLIGEQSNKSTPKFERAKLCDDLLYISGTAAIRGEESLSGVNATEQSITTLENIDELLSSSDFGRASSLRVYVKHKDDYPQIRDVVERYDSEQALYIFADICRTELLVEIEAIGEKVEHVIG